jgi:hypothetical protein
LKWAVRTISDVLILLSDYVEKFYIKVRIEMCRKMITAFAKATLDPYRASLWVSTGLVRIV